MNKMKVYGSRQCPDTTECLGVFDRSGFAYEFCDISDLAALKAFLHYRDSNSLFDSVRANGGVGIPLIVKDDGSLTFEWSEIL